MDDEAQYDARLVHQKPPTPHNEGNKTAEKEEGDRNGMEHKRMRRRTDTTVIFGSSYAKNKSIRMYKEVKKMYNVRLDYIYEEDE